MSGRQTNAYQIIDDYIGQVALRASASLDDVKKEVRGLESALKTANSGVVIVEKKTAGTTEFVMGSLAHSPLTVDECGNLAVEFRSGVMHYNGREGPVYMDSAHIIQLGAEPFEFKKFDSCTPAGITHCHARTPAWSCHAYLAKAVVEKVLKAELGYNGTLPQKVNKAFVEKVAANQ